MVLPKLNRKDILIALLLLAGFLTTRLINLTIIPIFTDEAIYLRWAQIAKNDAAWRFISLTDGKQPLFVWLTMVVMKVVSDPLVAGRLVSVGAGLTSLAAIWLLTFALFKNKKISFMSSLFYLLYPFALVYDRMALMDDLVGTFSLLSLFLAVLLVKTLRLDVALLLGFALSGGILTKTSGFLSIYFLPLTLLLFDWQKEKRWYRLKAWLILVFLAVVISQFFYAILRLSPLFHMISQKDSTFVYSFQEWLKHPFNFLWGNLKGEMDWLRRYLTWPWLLLVISSFFWKKYLKEKLFLFGWFLAPFTALALFGRVLYPRFIFFMTLPLLILVAYSFYRLTQRLAKRFLVFGFCVLIFGFVFYFDYQILFNPPHAPITFSDKAQYVTSWPSGTGIKEMVSFLEKEASRHPIVVATEGTFGMFPASIEIYLWDNENVEIKGYWPVTKIDQELIDKAKLMPVYFVFNETRDVPEKWPLELVAEYPKIQRPYSLRLYKVQI